MFRSIKTGLMALVLMATMAQSILAVSFPGGGKVTLSTTSAVNLTTGQASSMVNRVRVQVIPGQSCKIYVGPLALQSSVNNAFAVLFPNSVGGFSEFFDLQDPRSGDGIDITKIYVKTDCPGEGFYYHFYQTGTTVLGTLTPRTYGLKTSAASWTTFTSLVDGMSVVQVRILPGHVGKVEVGNWGGHAFASLYPNTGNTNQNNANSESWQLVDRSGSIRADLLALKPDIPGEGALVTVWGVV